MQHYEQPLSQPSQWWCKTYRLWHCTSAACICKAVLDWQTSSTTHATFSLLHLSPSYWLIQITDGSGCAGERSCWWGAAGSQRWTPRAEVRQDEVRWIIHWVSSLSLWPFSLLLFQSPSRRYISARRLQCCLLPRSLPCAIASSDSSSFSAHVELCISACSPCICFSFLYLISSPTSAIIPQLSFCNHCSSFHLKHHSSSSSSLSHHFLSFPARSVFQGAGVCILWACVLLCDRLILTLLISMEMEGRWCIQAAGSGEVTGNTPTVVNWQHVHQTGLNLKPLGLSAAQRHQQPVLMHSWPPPPTAIIAVKVNVM